MLHFSSIEYTLNSPKRNIKLSGSVESQSFLIIKGPSGSGKTTFLKILAKLKSADEGDVYFNNKNWNSYSLFQWRKLVHYVSQKPVIFPGTFLENLQILFNLRSNKNEMVFDQNKALDLMDKLWLSEKLLHNSAKTLSVGEASRMCLIRSILYGPAVLLIDEPVASLDDTTKEAVYTLLSSWLSEKKERGIILVSHDLRLLNLEGCSTLYIK